MRVVCDPLAGEASIPIHIDGLRCGELWTRRIDWICRDRRLDLQVLAAEPLPLPEPESSEPVEGAVARIVGALAGSGALALLRDPAAAFGVERIAFAEGLRLFSIASPEDEACWDAALTLGLPIYGLRGAIACEVLRPHPASVLSALAYGQFICEEGLTLGALHEDRSGVAWRTEAADAEATVVIRGGFEVGRIQGTSGSWRDQGNEGYVRVVVRSSQGACWTQPRFIAPKHAAD
jgi:hypothetical protein